MELIKYKEGETITVKIGEHFYTTPPMPAREQFLFHDLKKEEQYWRRSILLKDYPKEFFDWHDEQTPSGYGVELDAKKTEYVNGKLISLDKELSALIFDKESETGKVGLQEREMRRRVHGVWFFNNGEPTYLTGDHYAALMWLPMLGCTNTVERGSNYGQYYQFQRDACYYFEVCETVDYARGGIFVKPKKTGLTRLVGQICLNRAMTRAQKNIRMMSITEDLAKESIMKPIRYAADKVPAILMPSRSKQNEGEILFGPPDASKNPLRKKKNAIPIDYLHTMLCTVPTRREAFDTLTNYIAFTDEFPKIKESTYPKDLLEATLPTVKEGLSERMGTILWVSYVPEKTDKSFLQSRVIYKESKLRTRKTDPVTGEPYGDTASKLICHTLVASEGMFGCCDIYGKPLLQKVMQAIQKEIDDCNGDPLKIQAVRRQYPMSEADPWKETGREETPFDNLRLSAMAEKLEELHAVGAFPYKDFNLEFEKNPVKRKDSERYDFEGKIRIKFVTDDQKREGAQHGRWKWFHPEWSPEWFLEKYLNKVKKDPKTGLLMPNPDAPFFIAVDPTKYRISKNTGKGSQNSIQVFALPNTEVNTEIGRNITNRRLMCSYLYRHNKPSDTLNDIVATILLFGCMVQIESNVSTWVTKLIEMGLGNFVLMVNEEGALEPWSEHKKQYYFTSNKQQIDQYFDAGAEFLGEPMAAGEIDNIDYLEDLETIMQLMLIRKDNTTEYDAAVTFLQGQMGIDAWLGWRRANEKVKGPVSEVLRQFAINMLR